MDLSAIELIVFDMAGTTIDDRVNGVPLVVAALQKVFKQFLNLDITLEQVNPHRGKAKLEAIQALLAEAKSNFPSSVTRPLDVLSREMYASFTGVLDELTENGATEMVGSSEVFALCRKKGIKVAVGSGFPQKTVDALVRHLRWSVDYVGSIDRVGGKSRPNPAMIHDAMHVLGVTQPNKVLKVGDTKVDVQEGRHAGVCCIAVLSGTQTRAELETAKPDLILNSVADLIPLLKSSKL